MWVNTDASERVVRCTTNPFALDSYDNMNRLGCQASRVVTVPNCARPWLETPGGGRLISGWEPNAKPSNSVARAQLW